MKDSPNPVKDFPDPVKDSLDPVKGSLDPVKGSLDPVKGSPDPVKDSLDTGKDSRYRVKDSDSSLKPILTKKPFPQFIPNYVLRCFNIWFMINHLNGRLVEKNPAFAVIECNGVGYHVNISLYTYSKLPDNESCKIFTHLQINEDAHTLYGFADEDERRLFRNLISVSGVGASTARMILSSMNPVEIQECIVNEDAAKLKSVKGIGEKTAMRIIIELKDKMKKEGMIKSAGLQSSIHGHLKIKDEAMNALLTLGFTKPAVDKTLDQLIRQQPSMTVEDLIRQALKTL